MFSVTAVRTAFADALVQDKDVDIQQYVLAYEELCKFCSQLGTLFGFVVNDIQDKIGHLQALMVDDEQHFSTVRNMILYEKSNKKLNDNCGSITLLRLHRGLEFIILFMSKLLDLEPNQSTTHIAQEAYKKTLAKHHSFFIRHAAYFSMNLLPCQKNLYHQTIKDESLEETLEIIPDMISKASVVHDRINTLLSDNNILNKP